MQMSRLYHTQGQLRPRANSFYTLHLNDNFRELGPLYCDKNEKIHSYSYRSTVLCRNS